MLWWGTNPHENLWIFSLLEHSLQSGVILSVLQEGEPRLRVKELAIASPVIGSRVVNMPGKRKGPVHALF